MKLKTNLAYNKSNLQHSQKNKITTKNHVGRIYKTRPHIRTKFYIFSMLSATIFCSVFIFSLARSNELTIKLNQTKKLLKTQISEQIRLKTELEKNVNLQEIEKYARENLRMRRLDNSQINYIYSANENSIQLAQDSNSNSNSNVAKPKNFVDNLFSKIKNSFS